eukprot:gene5757-6460_t
MEDFPRGGSSALTPLEVRKVRQDAEKDVLFGDTSEVKKKKKPKQEKSSKISNTKDESANFSLPRTKSVEPLVFKKLSEGIHILGCIREIQTTELVVSLPNSLTGYVPITNINEHLCRQLKKGLQDDAEDEADDDEEQGGVDLHSLFKIGQFIPTIIKSLDSSKHGYKKIKLSVDPRDINANLNGANIRSNMVIWGCVLSVEDHGCIVTFGIKDITGFFSNENEGALKVGTIQWFLVKECKGKSRVLSLSADKSQIQKTKITQDSHIVFSSLLPGTLVNATVLQSSLEGVVVTFNGFEGVVDAIHLPDHGADAENIIKERKKIRCRIIYVNPVSKLVGLSTTQEILKLEEDVNVDDIIGNVDDCTVIKIVPGVGLLVELPSINKKGFVHISKVADVRVEKLGEKYKCGSMHACRILGFNGLDRLLMITLQKSVIEQPFLRYVDVKPGALVSGTILALEDVGMFVKISDHIKGLCPHVHLADINLKHPEKKFTPGKIVKCKVLSINPERRHLTLTHKKTLVNSDLPIFTSYKGITRGMKTHGVIQSIREYGLIIRFYNFVRGLASKDKLGLQNDENLEEVFFVGQVVRCTVISCDQSKGRLKLTLESNNFDHKTVLAERGNIVSGEVSKITPNGIDIQLSDIKSASLPKEHLSDFSCNQGPLLFLYETGSEKFKRIDNLVYLGERKKRHTVGLKAVGFIHHIMPYGIFIEFAPGILGLAPNSNLADYFISDASKCFQLGQTVIATVLEIDDEKKRLLVTIKPSENILSKSDVLFSKLSNEYLLRSLLDEREDILIKIADLPDGHIKHLSGMIGQVVKAKVTSVKFEGVRLQTDSGVNGFVPNNIRKGVDAETGDVMTCFVVDIDMSNWLFIARLIPEDTQLKTSTTGNKIKVGRDVESRIEYITNEYIVTSISTKDKNTIAYIAAKEHLNDVRDAANRYFIGQKVKATIHSITSSGIVVSNENSFENGKPTVGSMVTAEVKAVKASQVNIAVKNTNIHGRIHISEIWDEAKTGLCPLDEFKPGDSVRCKLIGFRNAKSNKYLPITHQQSTKDFAELSLRPSRINSSELTDFGKPKDAAEFEIGERVICYIKAVSENFLTVTVNEKVSGKLSILNSSADKKVLRHPTSHFKHGSSYNATVLSIDTEHGNLQLSFIGNPSDYVKKDGIVCGRIAKILSRTGLMIELPGHKCGIAHLTQLYDEYTEKPLDEFKPKMIVKCCILSVNSQDQIDLSLRPSRLHQQQTEVAEVIKDRPILSLDDIHENDILRGYVKSCTKCGLFVNLSSKIVGRVQIKNLSKYFVKNWEELFPVGKLVKAKVLSIDPNNNHIDLSLRGPDVNDKDPAPPPPKRPRNESESLEHNHKMTKKDGEELQSVKLCLVDDEALEAMDESPGESDSDEEVVVASNEVNKDTELPRLSLSTGFDWFESSADNKRKRKIESESESESENETKQVSAKKTKRQKRAAKKAEEAYLHQTELALLDKNRGPENAEDFDRLTRSQPNSSVVWIQYMAFYLHSAEVDKARSIAERALKTISFREEQDKFNVWIALLNLENLYGTDESIQNVFNEAVRQNDAKKIYLKMVDIYAHNNKSEKAEKLYHTMTRRFNTSKKVWVSYGFFLMKNGKAEAARKLLQRSFQSLPDRKHINTILKFAIMEFRFGDSQKGITMFESVLKNHPKRTDIWSVYIDMMIKEEEVDSVRNTFERIITMNLSTKKMKFIFKRYLEFEKTYGDGKLVEGVKKKAMNFVESKLPPSSFEQRNCHVFLQHELEPETFR